MGEVEQITDFTERGKWPFLVTIGSVSYPLDDGFNVQEGTLYGSLTVTQEMLKKGHDLEITVIQEEPQEAREGFLRFGKCARKER